MPRLSVWLIRTSLLYLGVGYTLGMLWNKGLPFSRVVWRFLPVHVEFLLLGWTMQLAMGVAFWILPRFVRGLARGEEPVVWLAYWLLNGGIWCVAYGSWLSGPAVLLVLGRSAELLSALLFAVHAWQRVKPHGV